MGCWADRCEGQGGTEAGGEFPTQTDIPSLRASRSDVPPTNIPLPPVQGGLWKAEGSKLNGQTSEEGGCAPFPGISNSSRWIFFAVACPLVLSPAKSQRESIYPNIPDFSQSPFAGLLLMYRQMIS